MLYRKQLLLLLVVGKPKRHVEIYKGVPSQQEPGDETSMTCRLLKVIPMEMTTTMMMHKMYSYRR